MNTTQGATVSGGGGESPLSRFALDGALLALLLDGPDHGYELYRRFEEILGTIWRVGRSRLYAVLTSLAEEGHLTVSMEPQEDKPPRKVFSLTDAGRERAELWLRSPVAPPRRIRVELISKLALIDHFDLPHGESLLTGQIVSCRKALRWARDNYEERRESSIERLTWSYRVEQLRATLHWLEGRLQELTGAAPGGEG